MGAWGAAGHLTEPLTRSSPHSSSTVSEEPGSSALWTQLRFRLLWQESKTPFPKGDICDSLRVLCICRRASINIQILILKNAIGRDLSNRLVQYPTQGSERPLSSPGSRWAPGPPSAPGMRLLKGFHCFYFIFFFQMRLLNFKINYK